MTVVAEKLPTEHTLLTVVDKVAARTAREARDAAAPVVARETPRKSGATAQALRPKATRTGTGHAVSIAVPRGRKHPRSSYGATINEVVRWVNRGTGELRVGPGRKRPIRGRRTGFTRGSLKVYGRVYRKVRGQDPNPFMDRIQLGADRRVTPILEAGAQVAARELERVID